MKTKLTKTKKIISLLLAMAIIVSSFAFYGTSYGYTRNLILGTEEHAQTDGPEDMLMFTYTPEKSGMFTFYQLSVRTLECYLFIKEEKPDGSKEFKQLAFSNSSPNFQNNEGQIKVEQFSLTYHLEKGQTYYFGVIPPYPQYSSLQVNVILKLNKYDEELISYIEANCPASLSWYTDGEWKTDSNGKQYFNYNISKLIANMEVTVHYTDGTTKQVVGSNNVDGLAIVYHHDQYNHHWYVKRDENYTSNDLTITILDKSVTVNVNIEESALYPVNCKVVDYYTGSPIKDANVYINSQAVGKTDDQGNISFTSGKGGFSLSIVFPNAIKNETFINVSNEYDKNDFTKTPFKLVTCDYVMDGIINAKDSAQLYKLDMPEYDKQQEMSEIDALLGANKDVYK